MGNIVLLDDLTINKIAAGEVIERPASVVKELVENSIDAGANNITVEIKNGGISYIRVTDNGKGIMQDDTEIAFERHATSKIRQATDLETVTSMGFRGEALASIAAISNTELVTKTEDAEFGQRIVVRGGNFIEKEATGCPKGTTITVTDLFFNTPVRYKFLKKDFTEAGYVEDAITRIALVHPEIAIKLINSGKVIIQTNGNGDKKSVIYNIYGKDVAENILNVDYQYEDIKITGVIGKPAIARSNRSNQLFFVNQRYIRDKVLTSAAEQGYKGMLTIGKYAFLVLNMEMNPQKVDVNVHPAKLEVRFEDENKIFKAIYHAIKDTLLKGDLIGNPDRQDENLKQEKVEKQELDEIREKINKIKAEQEYKPQVNLEWKQTTNTPKTEGLSLGELFKKIKDKTKEEEKEEISSNNLLEEIYNNRNEKINNLEPLEQQEETKKIGKELTEKIEQLENLKIEENFEQMYARTFGTLPKENEKIEEEPKEYELKQEELKTVENISIFEKAKETRQIPEYKFIGIAFSTYIIIEMDKELYIIDQHAAHERIMYEKIKENYYSDEEKDSQLMLLPDIINLSHKDMAIAKENIPIFEKAGFVLEEFGENTIKLSGVPNICIDLDTKELFLETLDEINTVARTAKQEIEEKFIATVACKAAVKANMALTKEEVEHLMNKLLLLPNPFTCPHGRPTAIRMTRIDIEKKFSRR